MIQSDTLFGAFQTTLEGCDPRGAYCRLCERDMVPDLGKEGSVARPGCGIQRETVCYVDLKHPL